MTRFFNTAGPCNPADHYVLPPERRLPEVRGLIDQKLYFVIHAARQVGKTTSTRALAASLTSEGRYVALHTSCESGQAAGGNVEAGVATVLAAMRSDAEDQLRPDLHPPPPDPTQPPHMRLHDLLTRWAVAAPRPVVVFFDEIDALMDETLIAVLRQLRHGYVTRPRRFPQSVALIGLRDVRDYKVRLRPEQESLGSASPFNIKVESITIRNFNREEVAELYDQHTAETGQRFEPDAKELAWELTRGQPWLVNALARQITEKDVRARGVPITAGHVEAAKEALIERRDTHLDSLIDRLREGRVRRVIEPILAGEFPLGDRLDDDVAFVEDLGLVERRNRGHVDIANPIYREVIPRALAGISALAIPHETEWYVGADGRLEFRKLLEAFVGFWRQHGEVFLKAQPYSEVAHQLVLMAFLQRVVNRGGMIDREYAVGMGRMDLCVRWRYAGGEQRDAMELKVWRSGRPDPEEPGLEQLSGYLERLGLEEGALVIFDARSEAPPIAQRGSFAERAHGERRITVLRL